MMKSVRIDGDLVAYSQQPTGASPRRTVIEVANDLMDKLQIAEVAPDDCHLSIAITTITVVGEAYNVDVT